ncbi:MAG: hypothetical protein JST04_18375 [Bdellovibrionales bacterium]|nr:hypothetical protein [Bdellovibrionales bacterium]
MKTKIFSAIALTILGFGCAHNQDVATQDGSVDREVASSGCDAQRFIDRVNKECDPGNGGKFLSNNDEKRIRDDAKFCKQVQSSGNLLEVAILDRTGDLAVIDTKGWQFGEKCSRSRFHYGSGFEDMLIADGYVYLSTAMRNAMVYSSYTKNLYMLASKSGNLYSDVDPVVGLKGNNSTGHPGCEIQLRSGNNPVWDNARIQSSVGGKQFIIQSQSPISGKSIFNDK